MGLKKNASDAEIKNMYYKLCYEYHPDKSGGGAVHADKFKEINAAYDVLKSADKRKRYDEARADLTSDSSYRS